MYQLDDNVVYVKGAKRGAIYDFISRKVFWINDEACTLLDKLVRNNSSISSLTATEQNYIDLLEDNNLWNNDYGIKEYMPQIEKSQTIEMAWLEITQKCNCRCLHCYQGEEHKQSVNILTLECVSNKDLKIRTFCLTDCGPSEGCNPDDYYYPEEEANKED